MKTLQIAPSGSLPCRVRPDWSRDVRKCAVCETMITLRDYGHKVWWFVPATTADRYAVSCECGEHRCASWHDAIKASEHWPNASDQATASEKL